MHKGKIEAMAAYPRLNVKIFSAMHSMLPAVYAAVKVQRSKCNPRIAIKAEMCNFGGLAIGREGAAPKNPTQCLDGSAVIRAAQWPMWRVEYNAMITMTIATLWQRPTALNSMLERRPHCNSLDL